MNAVFVTDSGDLGLFDSTSGLVTIFGRTANIYTDVALARDGTLYATTFTDLYRIRATGSGILSEDLVMTLPPGGTWSALDATADGSLIAAGGAEIIRIDPATASSQSLLPLFSPPAGDVVVIPGEVSATDFFLVSAATGEVYSQREGYPVLKIASGIRGDIFGLARSDSGDFLAFAADDVLRLDVLPFGLTLVADGPIDGTFNGAAAVPGSIPTISVRSGSDLFTFPAMPYVGPATGIAWEFRGTAAPSEEIAATQGNDFINGLAGTDVIFGDGGDDILDGGVGSSFLRGDAGTDIFFTDARDGQVGWTTIVDFVPGVEQVTIWGFRPGVSRVFWEENYGAEGNRGVTAFFDMDGSSQSDRSGVDFAVTFAGLTRPQLGQVYELDGLMWFRPAV